jgi:hypothetical protein
VSDALTTPLDLERCYRSLHSALDCVWLRKAPWAKGACLVREPDAGNLPFRFDEQDVETERRFDY